MRANREPSADCLAQDLLALAPEVQVPVMMLLRADDPRPWTATNDLVAALPHVQRVVFDRAGHAPWIERLADVRRLLRQALWLDQGNSPTGTSRL